MQRREILFTLMNVVRPKLLLAQAGVDGYKSRGCVPIFNYL
jgi:acetoin utilization deacetylase AcuC-like enzyme